MFGYGVVLSVLYAGMHQRAGKGKGILDCVI